jgi:hypothetical protein
MSGESLDLIILLMLMGILIYGMIGILAYGVMWFIHELLHDKILQGGLIFSGLYLLIMYFKNK